MKKAPLIAAAAVLTLGVGIFFGHRTWQAGMVLEAHGRRATYLPRSRNMGQVKVVFDNGTQKAYAVELGGDASHRFEVPAQGCVILETQPGPLSFRILEGQSLVEERREVLGGPKERLRFHHVYVYNRAAALSYVVERVRYSQSGKDPILGNLGLSDEALRKALTTEYTGQVFFDAGDIDHLFQQAPGSVSSTIGMAVRTRLSRKR